MAVLPFVAGALCTALVVWCVNYFAPGVYAKVFRRPPLHVHVERDEALMYAGLPNWIGSAWVLDGDETPETLGEPPTNVGREWRSWMRSKNAWDAGVTELQVTLQGLSTSAVVFDGIRVHYESQADAAGTVFICGVGGADVVPRAVAIDLDWPPGVVTYREDGGETTGELLLSLVQGESERFHIVASARSSRCVWTADLLLIVNGQRRTIRLDDGGEPFRTAGTDGRPHWRWSGGEWALLDLPDTI